MTNKDEEVEEIDLTISIEVTNQPRCPSIVTDPPAVTVAGA